MSKKQFKSHASSGRAGGGSLGGFGSAFGTGQSSVLSYVQEAPDYTTIVDPNIVVAFKNLSKKDSTTKAKALEDLQAYVSSSGIEIEEGFLEAWAKLFPRLAIDTARRVRQLSHVLNGQTCFKCGKRTVRFMPKMAGPWLAGTFDSDRAASRAAHDALHLVFPSAEKIHGVRKAFQGSILEYCRDAALNETAKTLSDERAVSADDAEATYARVVATSFSVVGSLLKELSSEEQAKEIHLYEEILANPSFWEFVSNSDASVRRAFHKMVRTCLSEQPNILTNNAEAVSTAYIYKGLPSNQTGSALDFVQTLNLLTAALPTIWTDAYTGKKPVKSRLIPCLKRGSQSSSAPYWELLADLFRKMPHPVLPTSEDGVRDLLSAARTGASTERLDASSAWLAYITIASVLTSSLAETEMEKSLFEHVMPLVRHHLDPTPETAEWNITGAKATLTISKTAEIPAIHALLLREWPVLADKVVEAARMSQPEQSKEYDRSQKQVAATGERWAALNKEFLDGNYGFSTRSLQTIKESNFRIITECIDLLKARNGKPYGSAAVMDAIICACVKHLMTDEAFNTHYLTFAEEDMPSLMLSPSCRYLVHGLYAITSESKFPVLFIGLLQVVLEDREASEAKVTTLRTIFSKSTPTEAIEAARNSLEFQTFVYNSSTSNDREFIALFSDLVRLGAVSTETTNSVLSALTSSLMISDHSESGLFAIERILQTDEAIVRSFMSDSNGPGELLLPNLVRLEQSSDDVVSEKSAALSSKLSSAMDDADSETKYNVVLRNLAKVSPASLPIDAVHELTTRLLGTQRTIQSPSEMIPDLDIWESALCATLKPPRPSLALLSPLGGAVHLVKSDIVSTKQAVPYDGEGLSQALRIAMYVGRLLVETDLLQRLDTKRPRVAALLHLSVLVAEDNTSIAGANRLWRATTDREIEAMVIDFVSDTNNVLAEYWGTLRPDEDSQPPSEYSQFFAVFEELRTKEDATSPLAYYVALSSSKVHASLFEMHGYNAQKVKTSEEILKKTRSSKDLLNVVQCLSGFQQPLTDSQILSRFCNELVTDLTDFDMVEKSEDGLKQLITLNAILRTQESAVAAVAKQRLIFLVKHIIPWLGSEVSSAIKAESCKALSELFVGIQDVYGEHWEQVIGCLLGLWASESNPSGDETIDEGHTLLAHASLKLFGTLKKLSRAEESNEDLVDALNDSKDRLYDGLVRMLVSANGISDENHQPLMITHEILARQVEQLPEQNLQNADELFPIVYTPSHPIQQAAFELLHRHIPKAQEQISFDAALENKTAQLPDELLSLVLEAPTLDSLADASFDRMMPISLQGYLYSWRLIFDHFSGSSFRVKSDYIEQLKEGTYLSALLDLVFDFLGHTRGRPVDAFKFDIQQYIPGTEPSPEKDVQWLLIHLYYLGLTYLPTSVKSYYLSIRSRQTVIAVESWTAKHISPLIINSSLQAVAEWAESSVKEDPEYEKMSIKVGMRSREINVSYVVDEQTMAIKVVLPEAYPLASAEVVGVNRVAVKEEKWQSWLRNCTGVITFSNGSITDGLSAWRKNVTGALKGQTECAICYSIISADKQLPTKRCPTCKYLFHSSCLFKWFKTSNASTCPLCRNPFNFN